MSVNVMPKQKVQRPVMADTKPQVPYSLQNDYDIEEDTTIDARCKLKNFTSQSAGLQSDTVYPYYCGLCGALSLVTNISLEEFNQRKTDGAICFDLQNNYIKSYLKQSGLKHIRRSLGVEEQYRWSCECGVLIAYQAVSYTDTLTLEKLKKLDNQDSVEWKKFKPKNKLFLYILEDSLVIDTLQSTLMQELQELQQNNIESK